MKNKFKTLFIAFITILTFSSCDKEYTIHNTKWKGELDYFDNNVRWTFVVNIKIEKNRTAYFTWESNQSGLEPQLFKAEYMYEDPEINFYVSASESPTEYSETWTGIIDKKEMKLKIGERLITLYKQKN